MDGETGDLVRPPAPAPARAQWALSAPATASSTGRRPLENWELPLLAGLGRALRQQRRASGLTQSTVACRAGISERYLRRLEAGQRRTRASTLVRLVGALEVADADDYLHELQALAGAALAPESDYQQRVDARRTRRRRRAARRPVVEHHAVHEQHEYGVLQTHTHRVRVSRTRTRDRTYRLLVTHAGKRRRLAE